MGPGRAVQVMFVLGLVTLAVRLVGLDPDQPEAVAVQVAMGATTMAVVAVFVAPPRHRAWWPAGVCVLSLVPAAAVLMSSDAALLGQLAVLLAFFSIVLAALDAYATDAEGLSALAAVDPLTGLANRRGAAQALASAVAATTAHGPDGGPPSLLLVDLDHFKRVNDVRGHQEGDEALRRASSATRAAVGPEGLVARWGGEEFLVLLPGGTGSRACAVAEDVRRAVAAAGDVTASLGLAACRPGDSVDSWLRRADDALYRAKDGGRDRVEAAVDVAVAS